MTSPFTSSELLQPDDRLPLSGKSRQWACGALLLLMAATSVVLVTVMRTYPEQPLRALPPLIALVMCLAALWCAWLGAGRRAVIAICAGTFLVLVSAGWVAGGLAAPAMMLAPLVAMMPGWVLGRRAALGFAAATWLLLALLLAAEQGGLLPPQAPAPSALRFTVLSLGLLLGLGLALFALRAQQDDRQRIDALVGQLNSALHSAQRREMEFRTLADNLPALVLRFDLLQQCQFANRTFCAVAHNADVAGQSLATLFNAANTGKLRALFLRACEGEKDLVEQLHDLNSGAASPCYEFSVFLERDASNLALSYLLLGYDVTERERTRLELKQATLHDALTGLPNRLALDDRLQQAASRVQRGTQGFALLALDLDGFKPINDQYGHPAGDAMLRHVATHLVAAVRAADTVARVGGDEFLILADGVASSDDAVALAEKLLAAAAQPMDYGAVSLRVGTSVGIALYPTNAPTIEDLKAAADRALYASKRSGRNRWACATDQG